MDVQNKLRLVVGSVKDQASISKAMIYRKDGYLSDIDIAILRATTHDQLPIDDKQLHEILLLVSNSSPSSISIPYLSRKISNRLRKTKNHFINLHGLPKLQLFLDQVLNCSSAFMPTFAKELRLLRIRFSISRIMQYKLKLFKLLKKACRQSCELSDFFQKYNRVIGSTSTKLALKFPTAKIITIDHVLVMEQYVNDNMGEVGSSISVVSHEDSEVPEELTIGTSSTTSLFSCKLETQISTEWVLFDD
ncbi:hypothetical protein MKX01_040440 [Papaver californicum]|nr:hypothetical protein MKX01_040440 [Papaver californicum]